LGVACLICVFLIMHVGHSLFLPSCCTRQCRSHRNASFPIKSSFFLGAHYHGKSSWRPPGSAVSLGGGGGGDRDRDWTLGMGMADSLSSRANAARTIDFGALDELPEYRQ
jgi:hypothetical protein